ncbi:MAG: AMP-dependent synthetase/ligase [Actinomycetota bacterium]|nr:AMP-dependent synthetase/ligase [Actinomycetota bacterium]
MTDPELIIDNMPATVWEAFTDTVRRRPDEVAVRRHDGAITWTWAELDTRVAAYATAFDRLGLRRGQTAALLMGNRPEFYAVDLALVRLGIVSVALYFTSSPEQQQHVLDDSGAAMLIAEPGLMGTLEGVRLPSHVLQLEGESVPGWSQLADLIGPPEDANLLAGVPPPAPDDVLALIYTSGTTGPSKGVMLTHVNVLTTAEATIDAQRVPEGSIVVSWLTYAHVGGRLSGYVTAVVQGWEIVTVDNPRTIAEAVAEIRPAFFSGPPRVFEKLRSSFESWLLEFDEAHRERVLAELSFSEQRVDLEQAGKTVPPDLVARTNAARRDLFGPWKVREGLDRLSVAVVATAPNPGPLMRFFHAIGIPMGEAYGLSESAAAGTACRPDRIRFGTVGTASRKMEIKLADDGEILLRGPSIMKGYLNLPEATAAAIDADGWLATGDLGALDVDGYLSVVGRKKEIIVNASGKNISPVTVESAIVSASPFISQACSVGDARAYLVAVIVLDREYVSQWAHGEGLAKLSLAELAEEPRLLERITNAVDAANARLNRPEQIKKFHVVADEWLPGRELTPTSKMRRREIHKRYEAAIAGMYS